jgi:hypothetical protein
MKAFPVVFLAAAFSCFSSGSNGFAGADERTVKVFPVESDELFANPGMGWQTFHRFADEDPNLAGLPSGSAYFRFYWREIEPAEGKIDFELFDRLLAHAAKAGQKLAFRVMCTGSGEYGRAQMAEGPRLQRD